MRVEIADAVVVAPHVSVVSHLRRSQAHPKPDEKLNQDEQCHVLGIRRICTMVVFYEIVANTSAATSIDWVVDTINTINNLCKPA